MRAQRTALDARPDLFAVGAGLAPFSDETDVDGLGTRHWPTHSDDVARRFSQLRMAVPNCAVMMRATHLALVGSYDETLDRCQDLDLFLRAHWLGFRFENLPDVLVDYRQDGRVQSFDYYRTNAVHHARVIRKHSRGLRSMNPFALVHRLVHSPTAPGTRCTGSSAVSEKERSDGGLAPARRPAPRHPHHRAPTSCLAALLMAVATAGIQVHDIFSFDLASPTCSGE